MNERLFNASLAVAAASLWILGAVMRGTKFDVFMAAVSAGWAAWTCGRFAIALAVGERRL